MPYVPRTWSAQATLTFSWDGIDGAPPLLGERGDFVYAPLWARYPHLQFARFPSTHSEASYNAYLGKLQAELEKKNKAVAEERAAKERAEKAAAA